MGTVESSGDSRVGLAATICGVLAVLAAFAAYFFIVPPLVLGLAAVVLGVRGRSRGARELAAVGIALGCTAILLIPANMIIENSGEDHGRNCALEPNDADC